MIQILLRYAVGSRILRFMQEQLAIQNLLQTRLGEMKRKNPSYSVRAFAKKVGLNSGALSAILNGKRNVSEILARRIAERLMLDPQERAELFSLFPEKRLYQKEGMKTDSVDPSYLQLSAAQYRVVGEWQHFAILTLLEVQDFDSSAEWIAKRLNLSVTKTEQSIARMISIGMLERNEEGKLIKAPQKFRTTDDVVDTSIRRSHEETLELAKESLSRDSIDERDFTHISLAIDPKNMSMAKELIRKFQDEFATLVESGNKAEVYRLSMQFFPLTVLDKSLEKKV